MAASMSEGPAETNRSRHTLHTVGQASSFEFEVSTLPSGQSTAGQGRSRATSLPAVHRRTHGSVQLIHDQFQDYQRKHRKMTLAIYAGFSPEGQGDELLRAPDSATNEPGGGGLSKNEVVANLVIACVGAGVVVFPKTMDSAGAVFAIPILATCALACSEAAALICHGCALAESLADLAPGAVRGYEALARHAGGSTAEALIMFTKNFAMIGFTVVYMSMEVGSALSFFDKDFRLNFSKNYGIELKTIVQFGVIMPIFIGLAFIKDLRVLAKFNTLGMLAVIGEIAAILLGSMFHFFDSDTCQTYGERINAADGQAIRTEGGEVCRWYKAQPDGGFLLKEGSATATCLFAFAVLGTIPSVRSQCANPREAPEAIRIGFFLVFLLYAVVMGLGYLGYGEGSPDNVLEAVAAQYKITGIVGSLSIMINIFISAPLFIICVLSAFEATGTSALHTPMSGPNCVVRVVFIIFCSSVSAVLPYVCEVIGLVSSCFGVFNNIFYPVVFMYALRKSAGAKAPEQAAWKPVVHTGLMVLGGFTMIFGVMGSWESLQKKIQENASSQGMIVASSTTTTTTPSSSFLESVVSI
eukprot:TRINITY_DN5493_c0_g1_i1.p1 TRINITY_DN5493_c0_g1~~TRINITY_DN5493_c0_g1_i1.p1  ORF type:complete len:583 (-),score=89.01 TRINITY_DN5493_c0_g1_i1:410-2158(-)